MKLESLKRARKLSRWADGLFLKNPIFVCGLALPFAVMVTGSLKTAVAISILLTCSLIPTVLIATMFGRYLPAWFEPILYALFSMAMVICSVPIITLISPDITDSLGIYAPILSVNTIMLTLCDRYSGKVFRPAMALADSICYSAGFAVAICLIAVVRELLGSGTLWGVAVRLPFTASGISIAFSGFLITAFGCAAMRFLKRVALRLTYIYHNPGKQGAA